MLAVHSGTGFSGYAASDRVPERIAAMVYVDTAPGIGALDPDFEGVEKPLVWEEIAAEENLDGLSEEQLETFRQRAVPEPGGVCARRRSSRTTPAATSRRRSSARGSRRASTRTYAEEQPARCLAGIPELRDVTWIDLPTSHWPMWSRPGELAEIIGEIANRAAEA